MRRKKHLNYPHCVYGLLLCLSLIVFFAIVQGVVCCGGGREFAGQTCAQIYRADSAKLPGWEGRCPNRRLRSPDSAAKLAHAPGTVGAEKQFQAPPQFVRWGHFAYIYAEKKHLNYPLQFSIDVERAVALCSAGAVPCGVWNNCAGGRASICAMGQGCDMGNFPKSRFRGAS